VEALPLALMSIRAMPNKATGLSPHEVQAAHPFPLKVAVLSKPVVDLTQLQEKQQQYVQSLLPVLSTGERCTANPE